MDSQVGITFTRKWRKVGLFYFRFYIFEQESKTTKCLKWLCVKRAREKTAREETAREETAREKTATGKNSEWKKQRLEKTATGK
ncbi:MAG: hypothetical protein ACRD52_18610, partial [Candidatus Acidiferrales bacterium]